MWVGTKSEDTSELAPTEGDVTRLRVILQGERVFEAGNGARFTPNAEVGLRHDGGDAETGTGIEIGAGVRYTAGPAHCRGPGALARCARGQRLRGMGHEWCDPRDSKLLGSRLDARHRPRMGGKRGAPPNGCGPRTMHAHSGRTVSSRPTADWS